MERGLFCQACRARLVLVRGDSDAGGSERRASSEPGAAAAGGAAAAPALGAPPDPGDEVAESFIWLDDRRAAAAGAGMATGPGGVRGLEESFVVLPGAASVLRPGPGPAGGPPPPQSAAAAAAAASSSQGQLRGGGGGGGGAAAAAAASSTRGSGPGLDAKMVTVAALCELASTATQVDHPLCLDCSATLKEEVEAQLAELHTEIAAYSKALARLEAEPAVEALSQEAFEAELAQLQAQTAAAQQEQHEAEQALAATMRELKAQQAIAADVDALEERYWHCFNEYQLALQQHLCERDSLLTRIDRAGQQLLLLKSTNVLNDVFRIWHDGPFGTISGFRLGRTPEFHVEWDEINAAWGQAVLLLHTMAQQCKLNFSAYRLLPMGSHPRVADRRGCYDLYGPVNKLWGSSYDRAMVLYLACLKEFGDFAAARDAAEGQPTLFEFPFAIEGDKVGNYTIKLSMLNKDSKWTKALKLMLANLKVALQWMIQRDVGGLAGHAPPALPRLEQEGPAHQQ